MTSEATATKCYCPGDCNCRHTGPPWHRFNYCGCRAHDATPTTTVDGKGAEMPVYTIRRFPSATGHVYFQVMGPFGRVYESTELSKAQAECARRNAALTA